MKNNQIKTILYIIFAIICIVNLALSGYIAKQKTHNDQVSADECFLGDGGCYTVQTSSYATTFGIKNPYYGYFFFALGTIIFSILAINTKKQFIGKEINKHLLDLVGFGLILGAIFSIWLLYVQFFILKATCIYCLWVDSLMIIGAVAFWVIKIRK